MVPGAPLTSAGQVSGAGSAAELLRYLQAGVPLLLADRGRPPLCCVSTTQLSSLEPLARMPAPCDLLRCQGLDVHYQ